MAARGKRHDRTIARESALALLYSSDVTGEAVADIVDNGQYPADDIEFAPYAEALVRGVQAHAADIDSYLESTSENWALDRMPVVDRAILRLAVYEMLYVDEVPVSVTINEAVELAKAYGGEDDSSRFVNGVLGRISRKIEAGDGADGDSGEGGETVDDATSGGDAVSQTEGKAADEADIAEEPAEEKAE
jgi:transcription antitermination protein NusB